MDCKKQKQKHSFIIIFSLVVCLVFCSTITMKRAKASTYNLYQIDTSASIEIPLLYSDLFEDELLHIVETNQDVYEFYYEDLFLFTINNSLNFNTSEYNLYVGLNLLYTINSNEFIMINSIINYTIALDGNNIVAYPNEMDTNIEDYNFFDYFYDAGNYIFFLSNDLTISNDSWIDFGFRDENWDINETNSFYYSEDFHIKDLLDSLSELLFNDSTIIRTYDFDYTEEQVEAIKDIFYNQGYQQGYLDTIADFPDVEGAYQRGYSDGVNNEKLLNGSTPLWVNIFNGINQILSIEIFPNISIGFLILFPLIFGILIFIIRLVR